MHADKSWQGDQSTMCPDQNHTPDTVVVVFPDRLRKCGETDFRQNQKASLCKTSLPRSVLSKQMYLYVQSVKQLKTRIILCSSTLTCLCLLFFMLHLG